jgi:hypothetical protein
MRLENQTEESSSKTALYRSAKELLVQQADKHAQQRSAESEK